jgi:hypothetical protein
MHSKYGKDGFAAISVSLDDPNEKGNKEKVVKFLESKKATFTNLMLNEKAEDWQAKLKIDGPPAVFVFNRQGGIAKKFYDDPPVDYADIEKLVVELLKTKE